MIDVPMAGKAEPVNTLSAGFVSRTEGNLGEYRFEKVAGKYIVYKSGFYSGGQLVVDVYVTKEEFLEFFETLL